MSHWSDVPAIFSTPPAWTTQDVPGFSGTFWAPDVEYFNGLYHLYYAVSTFGSQVSAIGMATSPTLNPSDSNYAWTDHGPVIESKNGYAYNTIDPSVVTRPDGTMWMSFGSYWTGIYQMQLNATTGMLLNPGATPIHLSQRSGSDTSLEASYQYYRGGYYYLFENWGSCCMGVNSTYNVRIGRSTSVNGPFVNQSGVNLLNGGGSLFLGVQGNYYGPGQVGIFSQNGQDYVSYHYYNGANNGTAAYALQDLYWTSDNWPTTFQPLVWSATTADRRGTAAARGTSRTPTSFMRQATRDGTIRDMRPSRLAPARRSRHCHFGAKRQRRRDHLQSGRQRQLYDCRRHSRHERPRTSQDSPSPQMLPPQSKVRFPGQAASS